MSSVDMKEDVIVPVISWIRRELNNLPVIVEQQNVPRPEDGPKDADGNVIYPYIGLMVTAPLTKIGRDNVIRPDGDVPYIIGGQRRFTLSIRSYADPANQNFYEAQNLLIRLQDSLEDETRRVELTEAGLAVWISNAILDTTVELESGFEPRAQFDVEFGIASNRDADLGGIGQVVFGPTIDGQPEDPFEAP